MKKRPTADLLAEAQRQLDLCHAHLDRALAIVRRLRVDEDREFHGAAYGELVAWADERAHPTDLLQNREPSRLRPERLIASTPIKRR
jgi:hypothetical protein